jgi:hypothetical protein
MQIYVVLIKFLPKFLTYKENVLVVEIWKWHLRLRKRRLLSRNLLDFDVSLLTTYLTKQCRLRLK